MHSPKLKSLDTDEKNHNRDLRSISAPSSPVLRPGVRWELGAFEALSI